MPRSRRRCGEKMALQLVAADGNSFRFRHALTHEAVLAGLLPPERAMLAGQALAAVEAAHSGLPGTWCTLAAELAEGAGDAGRAGTLLLEAGRRDLAVGALASAEHTLMQARMLTGADDVVLRTPVDEALTEVYALSGQVDRAIEMGKTLLARLGGQAESARAGMLHLGIAGAAIAGARWAEAEASIGVARRSADVSAAQVDACAAQVAAGRGLLSEAEELAQAALAVAENAGLPEVACEALEVIGRVARQHDLSAAEQAFERAVAVATVHGLQLWRLRALHELGTIDQLRTESVDRLQQARELTVAGEGRFTLTAEQAFALSDPDGPLYLPGAFVLALASLRAEPRISEAFRTGAGLAWHEQDSEVFDGCEQFFAPGYRANLVQSWIPALDGVEAKLRAGAKVADVGCGHGASTRIMAEAFPASVFTGYDYHGRSVEHASKAAADAGLGDRVRFAVAPADAFPGTGYDLITAFDCLHDMGHPVAAAARIRQALADDGTFLLVEPAAADDLAGTSTRSAASTTPSPPCCACPAHWPRNPRSCWATRRARPAPARFSPRPGSPGSAAPRRPRSTSSTRRARNDRGRCGRRNPDSGQHRRGAGLAGRPAGLPGDRRRARRGARPRVRAGHAHVGPASGGPGRAVPGAALRLPRVRRLRAVRSRDRLHARRGPARAA